MQHSDRGMTATVKPHTGLLVWREAWHRRCLVCDRELRGQDDGGGGAAEGRAKGAFLPRLEGMPPAQHAGAPAGPGLNTAELRRLVEQRLAGVSHAGCAIVGPHRSRHIMHRRATGVQVGVFLLPRRAGVRARRTARQRRGR